MVLKGGVGQLPGRVGPADRGRPAHVGGARGVVVVVGGSAAGAAAGDAVVHVAHGRVARWEVRREVAGGVVRRAYVLFVLLLKEGENGLLDLEVFFKVVIVILRW